MNLALIFADLHLHERPEFSQITESGLNSRLEEGLNIFDQVIDLAEREKIPHIIHLGDVFELKDRIPAHMLVELSYRLAKLNDLGIEFISLMGNHDFKLVKYPVMKAMKNVLFIEEARSYELEEDFWITFIPYIRDYQEFKSVWKEVYDLKKANIEKSNIVLFHQEVPGAWYNEKKKGESEFDLPLQENTMYLSGHIHAPQTIHDKITYLGSPYLTEFGEKDKRFVYILNDRLDLIPYQLDYPKFFQIDWNSRKASIFKIKGNYIQVTGVVEPALKQEVHNYKDFLLGRGAKGVSLKVKYLMENKTRIKSSSVTERQVLNEFLRIITTDLDKDRLEAVGNQLMGD